MSGPRQIMSALVFLTDAVGPMPYLRDKADRAPSVTPTSQPRTNRRNIARNEPCPCGSGKKFKVCCRES